MHNSSIILQNIRLKKGDQMSDTPEIKKDEFKDFIENVANIAGASKIISDGIQYVDNAMFWQWMRNSFPKMFENGLQTWMSIHPDNARVAFQTKGLEWDVFRNYHPNLIDINELSKATNDRIKDLSSYNPFTADITIIQVKAPLSAGGIKREAQKLFSHYPPETKFAVTQSVYDEAIKNGMSPDRFVQVVPDEAVKKITDQRYEAAAKNNIDIGITLDGFLEQVGQGALLGATIYIGVSALSNYRSYKCGDLSFDEFAERLIKDGAKGGVMGGSMAAINVGVQYAATAIGVGAPVTIPVMIVISVGLKKFVDPLFGDGEYKEILNSMKYSTSFQKGWLDFGLLSVSLFDKQIQLKSFVADKIEKGKLLNSFSKALDDKLDEELGKE